MKLNPPVSPHIQINYKWIKDLTIKVKTLKLPEGKAGNTLEVIGLAKDFLNKDTHCPGNWSSNKKVRL